MPVTSASRTAPARLSPPIVQLVIGLPASKLPLAGIWANAGSASAPQTIANSREAIWRGFMAWSSGWNRRARRASARTGSDRRAWRASRTARARAGRPRAACSRPAAGRRAGSSRWRCCARAARIAPLASTTRMSVSLCAAPAGFVTWPARPRRSSRPKSTRVRLPARTSTRRGGSCTASSIGRPSLSSSTRCTPGARSCTWKWPPASVRAHVAVDEHRNAGEVEVGTRAGRQCDDAGNAAFALVALADAAARRARAGHGEVGRSRNRRPCRPRRAA